MRRTPDHRAGHTWHGGMHGKSERHRVSNENQRIELLRRATCEIPFFCADWKLRAKILKVFWEKNVTRINFLKGLVVAERMLKLGRSKV